MSTATKFQDIARKIIVSCPSNALLPPGIAPVIGAAFAVTACVTLDSNGHKLLDPTQGQVPLKTTGTYINGVLTAGGSGAAVVIPGVLQLTSVEPAFAKTTGTFASAATTIAVASTTGIAAGQSITGLGIAANTLVVSIAAPNVVASIASTAAETATPLTFGIGAAGSTQGAATPLGNQYGTYNVASSTATNALGVGLFNVVGTSLATGSQSVYLVVNTSATNTINVYGATGDTINGVGGNAPVTIATGKARLFIDFAPGVWLSWLTA